MSGALFKLMVYGAQDIYLTGNPTECEHQYHHKCLLEYIEQCNKSNYNCPMCRHQINCSI